MDLDALFPTTAFSVEVERKEIQWVIMDLWQQGKINVMFGPEKAGKSRLLNLLLAALFSKDIVLDLAIMWKPKRILYLAGEEIPEEINGRMLHYAALMNEGEVTELPIDFIAASGMQLNQLEYRKWLENKLVDGGYDMLVIDPLRRVHDGDENDNSQMARIFNAMRRWTNSLGITMVLLHHTGKLSDDADMDRIATWGRGATDLAAILDTAQFVNRIGLDKVQVLRAGRFPPVKPVYLFDGRDEDYTFKRDYSRG